MRLQDSECSAIGDPVLGPHYEWTGDSDRHDKLASIGFPIWALRDVWSGKWLGIWVLPNNRLKLPIAYLYLSLVEELGGESALLLCLCIRIHLHAIGMPVQSTTNCGSENTEMHRLASALR